MGRLLLILKSLRRNIRRILSPQRVEVVRMNGNRIGEDVLNNTNTYLAAYGVILVGSFLLIAAVEAVLIFAINRFCPMLVGKKRKEKSNV